MSRYLRDGKLQYLTITESELDIIHGKLKEIADSANAEVMRQYQTDSFQQGSKTCRLVYIIRAAGKGVRYFTYDEFKKAFQASNNIERVFLAINTQENLQRNEGKRVELKFDVTNGNSNYLVEDDETVWVDGVTGGLIKIFENQGNYHHIFYSWWFALLIQIIGVLMIFMFCLWFSGIVAGRLQIENPFLFSFIGLFLLCSNIWTFILAGLKTFIEKEYPEIQFKGKNKLSWLWQGLALFFITCLISFLIPRIKEILLTGLK